MTSKSPQFAFLVVPLVAPTRESFGKHVGAVLKMRLSGVVKITPDAVLMTLGSMKIP